jgi:hypothetical protein
LERAEVPDSTLEMIKDELSNYSAVFSTSYDLILYWVIGYEEDADVWGGRTPVY